VIKRPAFRKYSKNRRPGDLHTRLSFCVSNMISESKYFDLKRRGKGPREIEIDGSVRITPEAEQDWRRMMEAETAERRKAAAADAAPETIT
jgi:hypothetical protein